ncbi:PDZ domain-containing protein [Algoriphagus boritolerans]|uniref:PDZ domain-containing protein n=1 Tax=Algoriphagus boritolerans TaxID=308111 RepID=UPI000A644575
MATTESKKIYSGESWNPNLKAPLAQPGATAKVGEYVVGVNGKAIASGTNLYSYFEGTANQPTKIHLNSKPGLDGSRVIQVIPVANEGQLRTIDWVEGNRRKVDELSEGKLAYVYIPNTGQPGYTSFNRYYFAQQDKKRRRNRRAKQWRGFGSGLHGGHHGPRPAWLFQFPC